MSACKHKVSGTISLPSRGSFHLSFTVLYAIGHWVVFRLGGWSPHIPTRFHVSGGTLVQLHLLSSFAYGTLTLFRWPSHAILLDSTLSFISWPNPKNISTFGLASSAFARHYSRNLGWFLFLALLRCFSSGGSPHLPMYSVNDDWTWLQPDCSIRIPTHRCLLTAKRGFSQFVASFVGSQCQGIPLALFVAWPCWVILVLLFA